MDKRGVRLCCFLWSVVGCPYRKSRPTFRCLHLRDLFLDTTHRLCESRFRDPTSRLWLSSFFSLQLHAHSLRHVSNRWRKSSPFANNLQFSTVPLNDPPSGFRIDCFGSPWRDSGWIGAPLFLSSNRRPSSNGIAKVFGFFGAGSRMHGS